MTRINRGVNVRGRPDPGDLFHTPASSVNVKKVIPLDPALVALRNAAGDAVQEILHEEFSDQATASHEEGLSLDELENIDLYKMLPIELRIEIAEFLCQDHTPYQWKDFLNMTAIMLLKKPAYLDYYDDQFREQDEVSLEVFLEKSSRFTLQLPAYVRKVGDLFVKIKDEFMPSDI